MNKTLDEKISRILADSSVGDFILADAKDGDMGGGVPSPGNNRGPDADRHPYRTHQEYMQYMRDVTEQGLVDIMLMSVSSSEQLTIKERLFDNSAVTPAIRANDTTDIWLKQRWLCESALLAVSQHDNRPCTVWQVAM